MKITKTIAAIGTFVAITHGVFAELDSAASLIKGIGYEEKTITHTKKRFLRKPIVTTETIRVEK